MYNVKTLTDLTRTFRGKSNGLRTSFFMIENPDRIKTLLKAAAAIGVSVREIETTSETGRTVTALAASYLC